MDLEPHEVERMDCNFQKARQERRTMGDSLEKLVVHEPVDQVEAEAEDWR